MYVASLRCRVKHGIEGTFQYLYYIIHIILTLSLVSTRNLHFYL